MTAQYYDYHIDKKKQQTNPPCVSLKVHGKNIINFTNREHGRKKVHLHFGSPVFIGKQKTSGLGSPEVGR